MKNLLIVFFTLMFIQGKAQIIAIKNTNDGKDYTFVKEVQKELGITLRIFNGKEVKNYSSKIKGSPYFLGEEFHVGDIKYNGVFYKSANLKYDLLIGNVITHYPDKTFIIELVPALIEYFSIDGHQFVNSRNIELVAKEFRDPGFLEILHDGNNKAYGFRSSIIEEKTTELGIVQEFKSKTIYFIYLNKKIQVIQKSKNLLSMMRSEKAEIKKILKENNISLKQNNETAIVEILKQYDRITKNVK